MVTTKHPSASFGKNAIDVLGTFLYMCRIETIKKNKILTSKININNSKCLYVFIK